MVVANELHFRSSIGIYLVIFVPPSADVEKRFVLIQAGQCLLVEDLDLWTNEISEFWFDHYFVGIFAQLLVPIFDACEMDSLSGDTKNGLIIDQ
jgi:hypothetical protein